MNLTHIPYMGDHWFIELSCHQADRKKFANAPNAHRVRLDEVNRACLKVIFE